jgi:cytochrome bd-type quinol oxidase subunit 1
MNYPVWEIPQIGGGMMIGLIAILHVFVSHFAVGGGLYLVLAERKAYRENDPAVLEYVKDHSLFFVLVVLVFGAVSGVGIWWSIGLVSPAATSTLLHVFVWAWAIEWVFFAVEIVAAFVYYYGWDRLDRHTHLIVGWIYFIAAWLSLFMINGILTFMLTPGRWLMTREFWDAFFNPTAIPSLIIRTMVSIALAGLYGLVTAAAIAERRLKAKMVRYAAGWLLPASLVLPLGGVWYISQIPPLAREISMGGSPAVMIFAGLSIALSAILFIFAFFGPFQRPQHFNLPFAFMLALIGLSVTGVTEWVREAVRKPYVIYGYMYSNGITKREQEAIQREGALAAAKWVTTREVREDNRQEVGRNLYEIQCASCHTIDGFNGMRFAVKGWRKEFIDFQLQHLSELKGFMPPFMGTEAERRALAAWLANLNPKITPITEPLAQRTVPPIAVAMGGAQAAD